MHNSEIRASFRGEVESKAAHLPVDARRRAIAFYVDRGRIGRAFVSECIQLAGQFAEQARAVDPQRTDGPRSASLPDTPLSDHTGRAWIQALTPRIEAEREAIWGKRSAPWDPAEWEQGAEWLLEEERRSREALGIPEGEFWTDEAKELREEVGRRAPQLQELTGQRVTVSYRPWNVTLARLGPRGWEVVTATAFGSPHLRRLSALCDEVEEATGFPAHEVTAWVLFDVTPRFERARVETRYAHVRTPGTVSREGETFPRLVSGASVRIAVWTPDVTNEDLRNLRTTIEAAWAGAGARTGGASGQRLTWQDVALLRAWKGAGGEQAEGGASFWETVRDRWLELHSEDPDRVPPPPEKAESVRRYWYRLKDKSEVLDHLPLDPEEESDDEA